MSTAGAAIAGILMTVNFVLSGCFSVMGAMGQAWSGSQGPDAKRDALVADVVTMPVQAPLIAGITVLALPELLKGDEPDRPVAGVTMVRLRAVDDEGMPLAGVRARVGYADVNRRRHPDGLPEGPSNNEGFFPSPIRASKMAYADFHAAKEGYYAVHVTEGRRLLTPKDGPPGEITVEIMLKRKRNPVPMFAKKIAYHWPKSEGSQGYDLAAGDWTPPHGKGKNTDLFLTRTFTKRSDDFDLELKITFPQSGDGIQPFETEKRSLGSNFQASSYLAPENSYLPNWTLRKSKRQGVRMENTFNPEGGYFVRVRTVLDADGKVISALYGKIHGDFWSMTHYLNPDGTRNIEYDPTRNLLKARSGVDSSDLMVMP